MNGVVSYGSRVDHVSQVVAPVRAAQLAARPADWPQPALVPRVAALPAGPGQARPGAALAAAGLHRQHGEE